MLDLMFHFRTREAPNRVIAKSMLLTSDVWYGVDATEKPPVR